MFQLPSDDRARCAAYCRRRSPPGAHFVFASDSLDGAFGAICRYPVVLLLFIPVRTVW
jgi:hypothetical protein